MTTDQLTASLTIGGVTYPIEGDAGCRVTLDLSWAPYISAEVTLPYSAALFAAADPRAGDVRARLRVDQAWYASKSVADLSADWAGLTVADLSAAWAGLTVADLSDLWGDRWGNAEWRTPLTWDLDLGLRRRRRQHAAGTIVLTVRSDEVLAQESYVPGGVARPAETLSSRFAALLDWLDGLGETSTNVPTVDLGALASTPVTAQEWPSSASVWDMLVGSCTPVGARPWVDGARVWRAVAATAAPTVTVPVTRWVDADDDTDRDGDWAEQVLLTIKAVIGGTDTVMETIAPSTIGTHKRMATCTIDLGEVASIPPTDTIGGASAIRGLLASQGRKLTGTHPADLAVIPGVRITTGAPSLPSLGARVESVTLDVAVAEMTTTTRDTTEV